MTERAYASPELIYDMRESMISEGWEASIEELCEVFGPEAVECFFVWLAQKETDGAEL